jgi:hypothetical protein
VVNEGMDGIAASSPDPPHQSLPLELVDVSLASSGRACACGPGPVVCLAGALTAGSHRAAAAAVTARTAPIAATNRTTLGRRLLIRFYSVPMLISLKGAAA